MPPRHCLSCGARGDADARFCPACGKPLAAAASAPPAKRGFFDSLGGLGGMVATLGRVVEEVVEVAGEAEAARGAFNTIRHPRGHEVVVGACARDPHDPTDVHYDRHLETDPDGLAPMIDLREHLTPVEDQGELGSCTANAIAGACEYLEKRATGRETPVSRLFIYYLERKLENTEAEDSGASLRSGMKVLSQYGACAEHLWPYDVQNFKEEPPEHAFHEARAHQVDEYRRVPIELHAMKTCLDEGYPFVFGTRIFQSFEEHGHHGRIELPRPGEKDLGGHAMLAVGYSDKDRVFVVRNSWGPDWGDGGYAYFPFDYLADPDYTHDGWTVRKATDLDFGDERGASSSGSFFDLGGSGGAADDGERAERPAEEEPPPDDDDEQTQPDEAPSPLDDDDDEATPVDAPADDEVTPVDEDTPADDDDSST